MANSYIYNGSQASGSSPVGYKFSNNCIGVFLTSGVLAVWAAGDGGRFVAPLVLILEAIRKHITIRLPTCLETIDWFPCWVDWVQITLQSATSLIL